MDKITDAEFLRFTDFRCRTLEEFHHTSESFELSGVERLLSIIAAQDTHIEGLEAQLRFATGSAS